MYDQFKYSIKVVEFDTLKKLKSLLSELTSLLDFLKIGKIASNRLSSHKNQYHQANCSSLVVNQSLRYQNQANFKVVKSANYFAHLMFAHPVAVVVSKMKLKIFLSNMFIRNNMFIRFPKIFLTTLLLGLHGYQEVQSRFAL